MQSNEAGRLASVRSREYESPANATTCSDGISDTHMQTAANRLGKVQGLDTTPKGTIQIVKF